MIPPKEVLNISSSGLLRERIRNVRQRLLCFLVIGDLLSVLLAMAIGFSLKMFTPIGLLGHSVPSDVNWLGYSSQFSLAAVLLLGLQFYSNSYSISGLLSSPVQGLRAAFYWGMLLALVSLGLKIDPAISRLFILFSTLCLAVALPMWRSIIKKTLLSRNHWRSCVQRRVLIVGCNSQVETMLQRTTDINRISPLSIIGVVGYSGNITLPKEVLQWPTGTNISELLNARHYDEVIVAEGCLEPEKIEEVQQACGRELIDFALLPEKVSSLNRCLQLESVQGVPLLTQSKRPLDRIEYSILKRFVDIIGAVVGLVLFSPIMALFCALVYIESKGSVFYKQERTGRGGKPFQIIKIRSMRLDAEADGGAQWCSEDDNRRLKIGAWMRRLNIDELPQFWNVLKGDMSLVGPRPERPELILEFKSEIHYYNTRHTVKPGITGWAQVNGWRGDTCLQSRIACDLEYIERAGFWFDLRILLMTLKSVKNAY